MPLLLRALDRLRRRLLIHRRPLAALCLGTAVLLTLTALRPPAPATVALWTAARDLPSGTVLDAEDLRRTPFTPGSAPAAAVPHLDDVLGRVLATPLGRGEVMTTAKVIGEDLLAGHPDRVAVPVRIPDAETVGLLRVGDRVSVVASDPQRRQRPERLLDDAAVLAVPAASGTSTGPGTSGRLVVLAVPSDAATHVAEAATSLYLTVIWNR